MLLIIIKWLLSSFHHSNKVLEINNLQRQKVIGLGFSSMAELILSLWVQSLANPLSPQSSPIMVFEIPVHDQADQLLSGLWGC